MRARRLRPFSNIWFLFYHVNVYHHTELTSLRSHPKTFTPIARRLMKEHAVTTYVN